MSSAPDPFERLGVPAAFELDPAVLRERVIRLSLRLHPDRAPDPVTAELNTRERAAINEAARVPENDERRAEAWACDRRTSHGSTVASLFDGKESGLTAIRHELNIWRYIERMIAQLRESDRGGV